MPLKYGAGKPEAVRVVGSLHGLFFVMLAIAVLLAWGMMKWKFSRPVIIMFCSVIPFAPFWLEHQLKKEQGSLKP